MTIISEKQIDAYLAYDGLTFDNNYQEAKNLVYSCCGKSRTLYLNMPKGYLEKSCCGKSHILFLDIAQGYMKKAEMEELPQNRAVLYAHVRKITAQDIKRGDEAEKLKEQATFQEAVICANVAKVCQIASLQAMWAFKSAYILAPYHDRNFPHPKEAIDKHLQAAESWELLADIYSIHKKNVTLSEASMITQFSDKPKYLAALFYERAAYSIRNASYITQCSEIDAHYLLIKRIQLIDKSAMTLKSLGLKINDYSFNAEYFERLAGIYQFKINTYKADQKEVVGELNLVSKVFKFRLKSAKLYGKVLVKNPNAVNLYYKKAFNLKEAACHAKTIEESQKLFKEASLSAAIFRTMKNLPLTHPLGHENDCESDSFNILLMASQYNHK